MKMSYAPGMSHEVHLGAAAGTWLLRQDSKMRHRLRLFTGDDVDVLPMRPQQMSVRLGDITRALTDAARRERTWLQDFEDDEIAVSADLYEIITAYIEMRPGA
ncbi:MAG: hypothetical protein SFV23_16480 [Planctomycetaceae bacterium]|nr:hypothetical protein [Planctomycetaceae bacterium]